MTPHGLPSELYHCLLDEQPHYLTPAWLLRNQELPGTVVVNFFVLVCLGGPSLSGHGGTDRFQR